MQNVELDEAQVGIKIVGRNINNLRYADDTTLMAESEEELKSFLTKVKEEESEKVGWKHNIQKTKIMATSPITPRQIDGETVETVTNFILGASKITADGDCSHEIKRCLLLRRKALTNLDSILKSRDIILPIKVHLVKALVFLAVTCGCENWTIKKVEHRRIDAFELWCGAPESPLDCKKIKPVNPKWNQFWIFIWRADSGKDPDGGRHWGLRWSGQKKMRCLHGIINLVDVCLSKLQEIVRDREDWHAAVHGVVQPHESDTITP